MNVFPKILLILMAAAVLTGCWNRTELPDKGFVMGVAIQDDKKGKVKLTAQLYRPTQKTGGQTSKQGPPFVNIETRGDSTFDAVRDITLHLGRKSQWSHMRVIIIDDKTARHRNLLSLLEFFYRDHEPRMTTKVLISKGDASQYLKAKPMIEQTASQQLKKIQESVYQWTGKVPSATLLQLSQALKSEVQDTTLPVAFLSPSNEITQSGMAVIHNGKMTGMLDSRQAEDILILTNQYKKGVLRIPCAQKRGNGKQAEGESIELQKVQTKINPIIVSGSLRVKMNVTIRGNIGELKCTKLEKREDEMALLKHIEQIIEKRLLKTAQLTQQRKIDLLGIGNSLYQRQNRVWKKWKKDWGRRYAEADMEIRVQIRLESTLTTVGKPIYLD